MQKEKEQKRKIDEVVDEVNNLILGQLAKGVLPWRQPWNPGEDCPRNAISKKGYRAGNYWYLSMVCQALGYDRPWFLTFKQAKELKGQVRKGEKSVPVLFWSIVKTKKDKAGKPLPEGQTETVPCLKYYRVFNIAQVDGVDWNTQLPAVPEPGRADWDPDEMSESVVLNMPQRPVMSVGSRACYMPGIDKVVVPDRSQYENRGSYYGTVFHELAHSTGHKTRLNRAGIVKVAAFGTETYSREELCAELASCYLLQRCGQLDAWELDNSASYIDGWSKFIKQDPRAFMVAAGQGQKAAEFILGESEVEK